MEFHKVCLGSRAGASVCREQPTRRGLSWKWGCQRLLSGRTEREQRLRVMAAEAGPAVPLGSDALRVPTEPPAWSAPDRNRALRSGRLEAGPSRENKRVARVSEPGEQRGAAAKSLTISLYFITRLMNYGLKMVPKQGRCCPERGGNSPTSSTVQRLGQIAPEGP